MTNLDKVANVWNDLDHSYTKMGKNLTKAQFLRTLLSNGNFDEVKSLLGKLAADIVTDEDNMSFSSLQKLMLSMANVYYQIPDELESINEFVLISLNGKPRVGDLGYLLSLINVAQTRVPTKVPFAASNVGMDIVGDGYVHMVEKVGEDTLVFKALSDISSFVSDGSDFQNKVRASLDKSKPSLSAVFLRDKSALSNKHTIEHGGKLYLVHEGVKAEVIVVE